ncbi:neuronal acetylcholine receptor subunit alpha-10-like [Mizuhopecten yessoensis]|uniref:neuronal acetylcholine receptor subunit alpha-10-like n=1 Tax=Mizuhopecten yessoensis TaxID=6573 RepID=UPI000B45838A|nr:neuronal acetylcholine receptor subunit alpha-10-like [Mizuhopecten yessoensis]XP_021368661.1 neuronal acetylcholine receptor subunit alpha-10-like [Mizuhopecten yessoensis]XP_021368662.1 neuronal acetylcholine receptor subunit alpha-10-like [Mizuhopecten yessoensis]XP_021368664.1 neuronal acetylcholine receptor subunit alpha-10-like [Mizuhopecten yessoensis]XP_021368665.1 neuronal acetylcholine receptor subunit alpha-10-like [Mizuhopecten yessoensis]XP_021368666.1 neuronal acetylcholine re
MKHDVELWLVSVCAVLCMVYSIAAGAGNETIEECLRSTNFNLTDEQRLLTKLMASYNKQTRPVFNASHPVKVKVGLTVTQIFDVDEKNQVVTVNVWLDQEWHDEKLSWNPDDYNGLSVMRIPCNNLWLPDMVLYNSASDYNEKYMEALAMVSHDGNVFWPPIVKLRSSCQMDITYFPFDDQICKMKMGSWAYDGFQVDVLNRSSNIDLTNYVENGEWELINTSSVRNVVTYPCCPEPFPDVTFSIHIRRRTTYYLYNVIIPSVMLSSLALLGFWLHPDGGEKVTLGLTVLLALSVFMLLIAENTPATSFYVPLLGVYLITTMSFTSCSVIVAVTVSNIHARGARDLKVPKGVKAFVICMSKMLCMKLRYIETGEYLGEVISGGLQKTSNGDVGGTNRVHCSENLTSLPGFEEQSNIQISTMNSPDVYSASILQALQCLIEQSHSHDGEELNRRQWEEVAFIVDRFFFWAFLLGMILSSVYLLAFSPMLLKQITL